MQMTGSRLSNGTVLSVYMERLSRAFKNLIVGSTVNPPSQIEVVSIYLCK